MPASLTNQVRLGYSMGWRIWTPNEVGFYAKTLAHSYFILVILKSKFLKNKLWLVNYNLFIGSRKYYVFVEFLKFGIKSKEERSYWKKVLYVSLLVRHTSFTKAYKQFRSKKGFKLKAIKRYIKLYVRKYKRKSKWERFKRKHILKRIVKVGKYRFLNSIKFSSKLRTHVTMPKKRKFRLSKKHNKNKYKKLKYGNFFKKLYIKLSGQKLSFKNKYRFKRIFTNFKKKKIKKFFFLRGGKSQKPRILKTFRKVSLFLKKNKSILKFATKKLKLKLKRSNKNRTLKYLIKNKKKKQLVNLAYRLKKKIVNRKSVVSNKNLKIRLLRLKLKIKRQRLFKIASNRFKKNKNSTLTSSRIAKYRDMRNFIIFGNLKKIKKIYIINKKHTDTMFKYLFKKKKRLALRQKLIKNYKHMVSSTGSTIDPKSDLMRIETVFEGFKSRPYDRAREFSITGGPRKRLSRNLKRAFLGKHLKFILNLIWFWEKIARLVSYYAGYAKFLQSYNPIYS